MTERTPTVGAIGAINEVVTAADALRSAAR